MSYARLPLGQQPQPAEHFELMNMTFSNLLNPVYTSKDSRMSAIRRRKLLFSYAPDWIITIVLAAVFFSLDSVHGYRREFSLEDTSLRHPYAIHERVPNLALYMICFVSPLLLQPVINFFTVRSWWDFHNASLGLVLGLALTGSATQFVKITVGRPRPDIIDRCQPATGAFDPPFGLTNWTICTQTDDAILNDGFRSFPSGHSSLSFAGLGFLSFYVAGKMHLFDKRGHAGKSWLAIAPFFAAALVAISRTMDYRHHWHDVLVGSALGTVLAYFSYRQYYPSLTSELSHRPYSPRIKSEGSELLPTHVDPSNPDASSSAYNPNGGSAAANRYNTTPSPPPFIPSEGYQPINYDLAGTVARPGPGSLEEIWKEGEGEVSRSVPTHAEGGEDSMAMPPYPQPLSYPLPTTSQTKLQTEQSAL